MPGRNIHTHKSINDRSPLHLSSYMQVFLLSKKPKGIPSTHEYTVIDFDDFGELLKLVEKPTVYYAKYQTALDKLYGIYVRLYDIDEVLVIGQSDIVLVIESFNKVFKITTQFFITEEEIREKLKVGIIKPLDHPDRFT